MPEGQMYSASKNGAISGQASNPQPMEGMDKQKSMRVPNGEGSTGSSRQLPMNSGTGPQSTSLPGESG